ncbi:DUF5682 family protein [Aeoliella sp.]|uniref:DUF5682 family protein n=1 Tax=Aeoliella sp. TaxID=2795800 RepID=UPI003CCBE257
MPEAIDSVHVFGVRHLSPSGAWHLRRYLDEVQPEAVLIEGLSDAGDLIADMTRRETKPPIAILAYTEDMPVRTLVYPIARYSPEYQAIAWAKENNAAAEWIDLPSDVFLALQSVRPTVEAPLPEHDETAPKAKEDEDTDADGDDEDDTLAEPATAPPERVSLYDQFAQQAGERDYETYWERQFEHNLSDHSYRLAALEFGKGLRELDVRSPLFMAENLVREAFMRRRIQEVIDSGVAPEKIVAVVGAYHASALGSDLPPMTDEELASLARRPSKLTLMPYSYYKLSSQSGYGAGNQAPAYFELLWEALQEDDLHGLSTRYLSLVARDMRTSGTHRSTAEVIEGVRLAQTMSALKGGQAPTLSDLQDAAVTLIGHGHRIAVRDSLVKVEVGTAIGELPHGVSQTSIQDDFERQLQRLKLEKYRKTVAERVGLDLRENRRVKSEAAAFLDLHRSSFFHRLRVLEVPFSKPEATRQDSATWAEAWVLQCSPESEIALVEAVLLGETVELATAYKFKATLEKCTSLADAATVVRDACLCGMMDSMELARQKLQALAATSSQFDLLAIAAWQLGLVVRYGDVRQFDPGPMVPLVEELFVGASLALFAAAGCDDSDVKPMMQAIDALNNVSLEFHDRVDEDLWIEQLQRLSDADNRNPMLSGYACAILLERGAIENDALAREVSRRISPGVPADLGAGWFEGLAQRNRYALLARQNLWEQLAEYIASLDDEEFRRALVFLRRAFGAFDANEKRHIAENLAEHWGIAEDTASQLLEAPLSEEEEKSLDDLNEFDFDDL